MFILVIIQGLGKTVPSIRELKIYHECIIGKDCIIHAGSVIGSDGFRFCTPVGQ
ncbi:MAG: hypothetical protein MZV63_69970 [Marinilabiliales bacterium]|nr:hypothetical protein [Marinilabiliales bacterium]